MSVTGSSSESTSNATVPGRPPRPPSTARRRIAARPRTGANSGPPTVSRTRSTLRRPSASRQVGLARDDDPVGAERAHVVGPLGPRHDRHDLGRVERAGERDRRRPHAAGRAGHDDPHPRERPGPAQALVGRDSREPDRGDRQRVDVGGDERDRVGGDGDVLGVAARTLGTDAAEALHHRDDVRAHARVDAARPAAATARPPSRGRARTGTARRRGPASCPRGPRGRSG